MTDNLSRVCALFSRARERVIVVSAYLGADTLEKLLDSVPAVVTQVTVVTRWDIRDITSGATDWRAWDVARASSASLRACPGLHAKVYVADEQALVGSANATASGLGGGGSGNLELLIPVAASQADVAQVLALAVQESTEAVPLGADASNHDSSSSDVPIWIPEISPDRFLKAFRGQSPHTDQTRRTCSVLRIPEHHQDDALLRSAVQNTTLFRVVSHEFDTRPTPMTVDGLRDLLADKVDFGFGEMSTKRLAPLIHWLGHFGTNTHVITSPGDLTPTLYPGGRLASYEFGD